MAAMRASRAWTPSGPGVAELGQARGDRVGLAFGTVALAFIPVLGIRGAARDAVGGAINASVMRLEERLQLAGGVVDGGGFSRERCWIGRIVIHADRVSIASVASVVVTGNRVVVD